MEQINAIQELVDEHREEMPTGVAVRLMNECQAAHDAAPKLYLLTWTVVSSKACVGGTNDVDVKLSSDTQTLLVEAAGYVKHPTSKTGCLMSEWQMPRFGMVHKNWIRDEVGRTMPYIVKKDAMIGDPLGADCEIIVHSLVPYEPRNKRARDA